ncbi:N-formylglutamate amidohydrolase [Legionella bononiensis]|uniref:N-formylglutamate amidohydrolase n=1 Tax=Legionella bononiensis TaxID=2793102 RepID=A0ABS1W9B7_9GAMM|nr:N-formylglutamate amidohydrolase [Legionella bononiensis]MBL7480871.1 N-formylglutamate amidohydrolase [Legionella bononiensis]MBL7525947.1 N-formylglutamate amidohydrolase [Legionella bononiensis]MBL7563986.1 N-formylglutamate amidohydrolase [Legionella bononiensis]
MKNSAIVISCEHAVDTVPEEYRALFTPFKELIKTHRGIDFGALAIALYLKDTLPSDFIQAHATRLLIDCNRSLNHPSCFSEVTKDLPAEEKTKIITRYYQPFREQVINLIQKQINQKLQVWHFSIHSFTPVMNNQVRSTDIGLLYNPQRPSEKVLCEQLQKELLQLNPNIRVRRNYPYKGISDGFTTFLRKKFTDAEYVGIEIESNQALTRNDQSIDILKKLLSDSLLKLLC